MRQKKLMVLLLLQSRMPNAELGSLPRLGPLLPVPLLRALWLIQLTRRPAVLRKQHAAQSLKRTIAPLLAKHNVQKGRRWLPPPARQTPATPPLIWTHAVPELRMHYAAQCL